MTNVLGSRMMGGGFGGCTLNLVKEDLFEDFKNQIQKTYQSEFRLRPDFIKVKLSEGARQVL